MIDHAPAHNDARVMTADAAPREIRLDDYVPYPFSFDEVRDARRWRHDEKLNS